MCWWSRAIGIAISLFVFAPVTALAAEITVTTAADQNGGNPAECSLREAIQAAILNAIVDGCPAGQAAPVVDVIRFSIGSGVQTITVDGTALDQILEPVFIDGTTQPGFVGTPLIELRRGTAPEGAYALRVMAAGSGSTIKGLAISDWSQRTNVDTAHDDPGYGVRIDGASNVTIQGNWFGLRATGAEGGGNAADLTIVNGAQNTQVGGSTPSARNVFAGASPGVNADSISVQGATTTGTRIQGNYFGLTPDGTARLSGATVTLSGGPSNTLIGGPTAAERNLFAVSILEFSGSGTGTQVIGNYFGVNVNGIGLPAGSSGLTLGAASSTVRNNALHTASIGGAGSVVQGNLVGLAPDGVTVLAGAGGLSVSGSGMTVGGTSAADRNVIAGVVSSSSSHGLTVSGSNTTVKGNYVGTDVTGQLARPNANGISVGGTGHQIGGAGAGEGNVVSGNTGYGIRVTGSGHTLTGNRIGVAADGASALGNGGQGITFNSSDSNPVFIGGTTPGAGNIIAHNGSQGVRNDWSTRRRVSILGNSIYANGSAGIQLGFTSPRPNDTNDVDSGPNDGQNYPVVTAALAGAGTTISGTLNSTPSTANYRIELFSNTSCEASGYGEGATFLGATTLTTDASGNGAFSTTVAATLSAGSPVTATATDPLGNTSEFSQCLAVGVGGSSAGFIVSPTSGLVTTEGGGQATFTVRLNTAPTGAVTVGLASSNLAEGTVSPSSLTFQAGPSALVPQTVTVTGVDDATVDGAVAYTIVTAPASSTDGSYHGLNPADVSVTNQDNDAACSTPRPKVQVTTTKGAPGTLNVTVLAGQGAISKIEFGASRPSQNAQVSVVGGPQNQSGAFVFTPPSSVSTAQFTVVSQNRSLATTVHVVVTDGCGAWPTFVGGGPGSF